MIIPPSDDWTFTPDDICPPSSERWWTGFRFGMMYGLALGLIGMIGVLYLSRP